MNLGGILKIVAPIALTVVTGGAAAPLALTLQQLAIKAAVQVAIQKFGQELGLPQSVIIFSQLVGASQIGGPAGNSASIFDQIKSSRDILPFLNASVAEYGEGSFSSTVQGDISRSFASYDSNIAALTNRLSNTSDARLRENLENAIEVVADSKRALDTFLTNNILEGRNREAEREIRGVMSGKGSLLMKLAIALGKIADKKMEDAATKADQLGRFGEVKGKNQGKFQQLSAEISALGQELSAITSATSNVIRSIGEGAATLARK